MNAHTYDEAHAVLMGDAEFRQLREGEAFARAVSIEVLRFRLAHDLTRGRFAEYPGVPVETVVTLEDGEEPPDLATMVRLSERLGLTFAITITPVDAIGPAMGPSGGRTARISGGVAAA